MKFTKPNANQEFKISSAPKWPTIIFQTDAKGPHIWTWKISWRDKEKIGKAHTPGNQWDATLALQDLGGTLTVTAVAGKLQATISVSIKGTNPSKEEVETFLKKQPHNAGFEKIIQHESNFEHFNGYDEPIRSHDYGYGMCQLTRPPPSYAQIWNWTLNIKAGLALFATKVSESIQYLSQDKRSYTAEQLQFEAVSRWNGGAYHEWNAGAKAWKRHAHILCDSATGNIGWDMTHEKNKGKSESELRRRDKSEYTNPPGPKSHWRYSGICYADRLLK